MARLTDGNDSKSRGMLVVEAQEQAPSRLQNHHWEVIDQDAAALASGYSVESSVQAALASAGHRQATVGPPIYSGEGCMGGRAESSSLR